MALTRFSCARCAAAFEYGTRTVDWRARFAGWGMSSTSLADSGPAPGVSDPAMSDGGARLRPFSHASTSSSTISMTSRLASGAAPELAKSSVVSWVATSSAGSGLSDRLMASAATGDSEVLCTQQRLARVGKRMKNEQLTCLMPREEHHTVRVGRCSILCISLRAHCRLFLTARSARPPPRALP